MSQPTAPGMPGSVGETATLISVIDPLNYVITLDAYTWEMHIVKNHPEMIDFQDLIAPTAEKPQLIQSALSNGTCYYYRLTGRSFYKINDLYLSLVVARSEWTKTGAIQTAHLLKNIRKGGNTIWMR